MSLYETILKAAENPQPGTTTIASNKRGDDHVYLTVYNLGAGNNVTVLYRALSLAVIEQGQWVLTEAAYQQWASQCKALRARYPQPVTGGYIPNHRKTANGTWTRW